MVPRVIVYGGGMRKARRWSTRDVGAVLRRADADLPAPSGPRGGGDDQAIYPRLGDAGRRIAALHGSPTLTTFDVSYPPSANHSHYKSGRLKDAVRSWRRRAGWAYKAAGGTRLEGP